jgi:hypothetical protein
MRIAEFGMRIENRKTENSEMRDNNNSMKHVSSLYDNILMLLVFIPDSAICIPQWGTP